MMEENNEESYTETQELNEIAGLALRFNKRGAFEQMVANHLVLSVNSEHLHKVTLVCEAVYMSDIDKLKIDKETVNKIYAVALFFLEQTTRATLSLSLGTFRNQNKTTISTLKTG